MGEDKCDCAFENWANSEYIELEIDWTKVPADTPVLVGNDKRSMDSEDIFVNIVI